MGSKKNAISNVQGLGSSALLASLIKAAGYELVKAPAIELSTDRRLVPSLSEVDRLNLDTNALTDALIALIGKLSITPGSKSAPLATGSPTGLLRLPQILGDPKADPPIAPIVPVCRSAWWAGVKSGRYPKPIKLSPRVTAWYATDIAALVSKSEVGGKA